MYQIVALNEHTPSDPYDAGQEPAFDHCVHRLRARSQDRGNLADEKQRWSANSQVVVLSHHVLTALQSSLSVPFA
jgi:hypothetical protein